MAWKWLKDWWPVLAGGGSLLALGAAGVAAWATLRADVDNLKDSVKELKERPVASAPLSTPTATLQRITKGDLCRDLFGGQLSTRDKDKIDRINKQLEKLDCFDGIPAAATIAEPGEIESANAVLLTGPDQGE